jgi:Predicted NADH:ubiquinone oxidoreductase, subunit RnfB
MNIILVAIISLGLVGLLASILLYGVSKKFTVYEDPRIAQIQDLLPGANCGACGFPGCPGFATQLVKADSLDNLACPVGGQSLMNEIAGILGKTSEAVHPKIAVLHCNGTCDNRSQVNRYDGVSSCRIASNLYGGATSCSFGCLGMGDCVKICPFGALSMNETTMLPEVDEDKCTACGKCVNACPKNLFDLRKKGIKGRRVYVSCMNKDKPAATAKSCKVGCIACKKCQKECAFEAIEIDNNLAKINDDKCRLCRKCVSICPVNAIVECNFPKKEA